MYIVTYIHTSSSTPGLAFYLGRPRSQLLSGKLVKLPLIFLTDRYCIVSKMKDLIESSCLASSGANYVVPVFTDWHLPINCTYIGEDSEMCCGYSNSFRHVPSMILGIPVSSNTCIK